MKELIKKKLSYYPYRYLYLIFLGILLYPIWLYNLTHSNCKINIQHEFYNKRKDYYTPQLQIIIHNILCVICLSFTKILITLYVLSIISIFL